MAKAPRVIPLDKPDYQLIKGKAGKELAAESTIAELVKLTRAASPELLKKALVRNRVSITKDQMRVKGSKVRGVRDGACAAERARRGGSTAASVSDVLFLEALPSHASASASSRSFGSPSCKAQGQALLHAKQSGRAAAAEGREERAAERRAKARQAHS